MRIMTTQQMLYIYIYIIYVYDCCDDTGLQEHHTMIFHSMLMMLVTHIMHIIVIIMLIMIFQGPR